MLTLIYMKFWLIMAMLPDRTDRVIINLKVLAYVKPGERIAMHNNSFSIQQAGWGQCLQRWQYGETRWTSLVNIQNVVEDALRIIGTYVTMFKLQMNDIEPDVTQAQYPVPTPESCANYINDMGREIQNAMVGLQNLKMTYEFDQLMLSHLDLIIQKMKDDTASAQRVLTAGVHKLKKQDNNPLQLEQSSTQLQRIFQPQARTPSPCQSPLHTHLAVPVNHSFPLQNETATTEPPPLSLAILSSPGVPSVTPLVSDPSRQDVSLMGPVSTNSISTQSSHHVSLELSSFHTPSGSPILSSQQAVPQLLEQTLSPSLPPTQPSISLINSAKKKNMDRGAAGH